MSMLANTDVKRVETVYEIDQSCTKNGTPRPKFYTSLKVTKIDVKLVRKI